MKSTRKRLNSKWLARLGLNQRPLPCQGGEARSWGVEHVGKNSLGQWEIANTSSVLPAIEWKNGLPRIYRVAVPGVAIRSDKSVTSRKRRAG